MSIDERRHTVESMAIEALKGNWDSARQLAELLLENVNVVGTPIFPARKLTANVGKLRFLIHVKQNGAISAETGPRLERALRDWLAGGSVSLALAGVDRVEVYEFPDSAENVLPQPAADPSLTRFTPNNIVLREGGPTGPTSGGGGGATTQSSSGEREDSLLRRLTREDLNDFVEIADTSTSVQDANAAMETLERAAEVLGLSVDEARSMNWRQVADWIINSPEWQRLDRERRPTGNSFLNEVAERRRLRGVRHPVGLRVEAEEHIERLGELADGCEESQDDLESIALSYGVTQEAIDDADFWADVVALITVSEGWNNIDWSDPERS